MKHFYFDLNVINTVISEIEIAEDYIRIAIFQIHHEGVINALNKKLIEGVRVEIFTLPFDSINEDIRSEVTRRLKVLEKNGALLHFCKWNVGDPERTTTAVGRWYSFHGKFIVTDKSAIALTANLTETPELDAILIFNDNSKIHQFNKRFDYLVHLFIDEHSGYDGAIRELIVEADKNNSSPDNNIFNLPRVIGTNTHKNHWIQHYPAGICPSAQELEDQLYILPFDCTARSLIELILNDSKKFVYISAESFTDPNFTTILKKVRITKNIDIRMLAGVKSMDFSERMRDNYIDLTAAGVKIRATEDPLHAKLIITDNNLAISSVNINKMNLGFRKTFRYWRGNTETLYVCSQASLINCAKERYNQIFEQSTDVWEKLAEKIKSGSVSILLNQTLGLKAKQNVKAVFAKFIIKEQISLQESIVKIGKSIIDLQMLFYGKLKLVGMDEFVSALILLFLSESQLNYNQICDKLHALDPSIQVIRVLKLLLAHKLIEEVDGYYKINVGKLIT